MAINNFKININSVDNYIHKNKKCTSTRMPTVILPRCKLLTRRQYTCMQARTGGVNVYYGNARNCRLMPLACSRNQPSVGSRQVVSLSLSLSHTHTHTHRVWGFLSSGLKMLEFFQERDVLQGNAIAEAVSRRLPTAQSEVPYFELMKPATVPNVTCGAGTDCVFRFMWPCIVNVG